MPTGSREITMSESTGAEGAQGTTDTGDGSTQAEYKPPATQADLDRIIAHSLSRQRAQFKDFDQFKADSTELATIKAANQTVEQKQAEELTRWQTETQTWRTAAVGNRIQALASTDFADASDAVAALSSKNYLDAGGQIDEAAIKADLDELLTAKPHWARPEGTSAPRVPAPNPHQGTPGTPVAADPRQAFASVMQQALRQ